MRASLIWDFKGHNDGMFNKGPNWFQITVPPSRKKRRVSLIVTYKTAHADRAR